MMEQRAAGTLTVQETGKLAKVADIKCFCI